MTSLEDLLDHAAAALLTGDLAALARITPAIESASLAAPDHATATRLAQKARRNARLLDAAGRGVKAARLRLAEITHGPTLSTYDARGHKAQLPPFGAERARRV
jgi:hypothetical protein